MFLATKKYAPGRTGRTHCEVNRAAKSKTASRIARTTWGFRQSEEGAKSTEDRAGNQTWQLEIYGISDMDMIQGVYFILF